MSSDFKVTKCLEWCTELPSEDHPRESPTFFLKGNEFFIQLKLLYELKIFDAEWYCEFFLKLKKKYADIEPDNIRFQIGFKNQETLSLKKGKFKVSESCEFWYIKENKLRSKLPEDYMLGNYIKILFYFDNMDEPFLKTSKETDDKTIPALSHSDDKSVQTLSYTDTHFMLESVSKDLSTLLDQSLNYDVEFICEDGKVKAHKNILCCRSSVFASMLQSDMVEGKTGQVNIQDMNITIFQQFLRCLYTGLLPELTINDALQFYETGDKYDVGSLKKNCADYLTDNLSPENACDILIVADRHGDSDFKKSVIEYMMEKKIPLKGEEWIEFCKKNPILATEVLNLFCQRFCQK